MREMPKDKRPTKGGSAGSGHSKKSLTPNADEPGVSGPGEHPRRFVMFTEDLRKGAGQLAKLLADAATFCERLVDYGIYTRQDGSVASVDYNAFIHELPTFYPVAMDLLDAARIVVELGDATGSKAMVREVRDYIDAKREMPRIRALLPDDRIHDRPAAGRAFIKSVERIARKHEVRARARPEGGPAVGSNARPSHAAVDVAHEIAEELFQPKKYRPILMCLPADFPTRDALFDAARLVDQFFQEQINAKPLTLERARLLGRLTLRAFGCKQRNVSMIFGADDRMRRRKDKAREERPPRTS